MLKMQRHHTLICVEREHDMIIQSRHHSTTIKVILVQLTLPTTQSLFQSETVFFNVVTE